MAMDDMIRVQQLLASLPEMTKNDWALLTMACASQVNLPADVLCQLAKQLAYVVRNAT